MTLRHPIGSLLLIVAGALGGLAGPDLARARDEPGAPDDRREDREAVRAALRAFVEAFEARDAEAVADHFTEGGEYQREGEGAIRGREALLDGFKAAFADAPKVVAEVEPEPVRFLSRENALAEGTVAIRSNPGEPAVVAHYSALMVREDGRWRIALLRESPGAEEDSLKGLAWLVGDWKSTEPGGAEVTSSYAWDESGKFLRVRFTIKEADHALGGFQVLGNDPATGALRAWTFGADGGIGEAVWVRDGEHWTAEATGTLADGRTLAATNILRRIDGDTFTWQSIDRRLDDEPIPDLPPVKVSRVKPPK